MKKSIKALLFYQPLLKHRDSVILEDEEFEKVDWNGKPYINLHLRYVDSLNETATTYLEKLETENENLKQQTLFFQSEITRLHQEFRQCLKDKELYFSNLKSLSLQAEKKEKDHFNKIITLRGSQIENMQRALHANNTTIETLKKEKDSLKDEMHQLKHERFELQKTINQKVEENNICKGEMGLNKYITIPTEIVKRFDFFRKNLQRLRKENKALDILLFRKDQMIEQLQKKLQGKDDLKIKNI